jgi:hypothetical protein
LAVLGPPRSGNHRASPPPTSPTATTKNSAVNRAGKPASSVPRCPSGTHAKLTCPAAGFLAYSAWARLHAQSTPKRPRRAPLRNAEPPPGTSPECRGLQAIVAVRRRASFSSALLAMQKVVGSNPISRFIEARLGAGLSRSDGAPTPPAPRLRGFRGVRVANVPRPCRARSSRCSQYASSPARRCPSPSRIPR